MTNSDSLRYQLLHFSQNDVFGWRDEKGYHHEWPVVYVLQGNDSVYVGESTNAKNRLSQHLKDPRKTHFNEIRIILNDEFNKSVCLDLESKLISWFHADSQFKPLNRNDGQQNANYFERDERYLPLIQKIFNDLRAEGLFTRTIPQLENLNIFKLSPFKALNDEQLAAVDGIVEGLFSDLEENKSSVSVIQGGPGTGKTIVAIFLLKLLRDIQETQDFDAVDENGRFSDFFVRGYSELLENKSIGFVVPQQSLRKTISKVFKNTPSLNSVKVLSPYTVAASDEIWDLLVVDEAHRLTHRGSGPTRGQFKERNVKLFGEDAANKTAIDWIIARSRHSIFLVDGLQTVRPADVLKATVDDLILRAKSDSRHYTLESQMRVSAGENYLQFAERLLTNSPIAFKKESSYDLRLFDSFDEFVNAVRTVNHEFGLSRIVAGYAWPWLSKGNAGDDAPFDITIDNVNLRWNRTDTDWIASPNSENEVGSVHTVQGYDLNYAGVIIGPDIKWDDKTQTIQPVRDSHFDKEVRSVKSDADLLKYIQNAYYVMLTRGIMGTYVYVYDEALRNRLRSLFFDSGNW